MHCEISSLGEPKPLPVVGVDAIANLLVRGRDGVILQLDDRRSFYLPIVWDKIPEPRDFLAALCRKAGLDAEIHGPLVSASVLEVEMFSEEVH